MHSQSLKSIAVGQCNKSAQLIFYHPVTAKTVALDDFSLDATLYIGPCFGLKYGGGIYVGKYYDQAETYASPKFDPSQIKYVRVKGNYKKSQ